MIVVIQCAGSKRKNAGHLKTHDGRRVVFVTDPVAAPAREGVHYARPDDSAGDGETWREKLVNYNQGPKGDPDRLLPAYQLYKNDCYRRLAEAVGVSQLFILSAGWGLISASFLTPYYDITFSSQAEPCSRRRVSEKSYSDFQHLVPFDAQVPVLFFGGKSYLPLFDCLTSHLQNQRIVFYRTPRDGSSKPAMAPKIRNGRAVGFRTNRCTNWQYECADKFLTGELDVEINYDGAGANIP